MNKKIFAILFISIFLMASISFISAAEDNDDAVNASNPIKVKIVWDDDGKATDRPVQIIVNLLHDGKVVESIELNESNSWNSTFKTQDEGGNYEVKLNDNLSDYSVSYNGSVEKGFEIKNTLNKTPLGKAAADNETDNVTKNNTDNKTDNVTKNNTDNKTNNVTKNNTNNKTNNVTKKDTKDNKTDNVTKKDTKDNKTDNVTKSNTNNKTDNVTKNETKDNKTDNQTKNTTNSNNQSKNKTDNQTLNKTKDNSTPKKEVPNLNSKKPINMNGNPQVNIAKLKNTGLPIIAVSLIAILAGYLVLRRRS